MALKTDKFDIVYFQQYVETYHERHPEQQNIMFLDMLYGVGLAIDSEKFKGKSGFDAFKDWLAEGVNDEQNERFMLEMAAEENKRFADEKKHNDEILDELRSTLGETYVQRIIECLKEAEADGKLEIVEKPKIEKQFENWDEFDHVLVDQYVNGGMSGDDYAGNIYVPIGGGEYLKSHYSM